MLLNKDRTGTSAYVIIVMIICMVFIALEGFLPDFTYSKSLLIGIMHRTLTQENAGNVNTDSVYFMDASERKILEWYQLRMNASILDNMGYFTKAEQIFNSTLEINKQFNIDTCQRYLQMQTFSSDPSYYKTADKKQTMLNLIRDSLPIFCRIVTANIGSFFDSPELNKYFSVALLNGIKKEFVDSFNFDLVSNTSSIPQEIANQYLVALITANQKISVQIQDKMFACRSIILYKPEQCFQASDYATFTQATMTTTFQVNYNELNVYFTGQWNAYSQIVGASVPPNANDQVTDTVLRHIMLRSNLILSFEKDVDKLRLMLTGVSISHRSLKTRCNNDYFFTDSCKLKNYVAISMPCLGDIRISESELRRIECQLPSMTVPMSYRSLIDRTVLQNIGKEIGGTPTFSAQVYFWNIYDTQIAP